MKKIVFISNVDSGGGMSGGSRIYLEFLKNWQDKINVIFFGSQGTIQRIKTAQVKNIEYYPITEQDQANLYSMVGVIKYTARRLVKGLKAVKETIATIEQADYIYSVSDFYPDFLPAFYAKLKCPKIKWIAGYYLFAPAPFSVNSPYKGKNRIRGLLYWLMQWPSYLIVKHLADYVFVTSAPDVKNFITKKRSQEKIIIVQGGVDITDSENYLQSGQVIPVEKRKYDACFVGRFHYQKGVVELVEIWKKVCQQKMMLN